ncbi:MAG TPA: GyrI-like domain-containing protein [Bdellovibrionales bacterium]|nr:GyrI-like domain-containing protein [Bdellovibrionales bacterium]
MKKLVLLVIATVVALLASLYFRLGADKDVVITLEEVGPYQVAYKNHLGEYHKIVPIIEEVEKWMKSLGLKCQVSFGEYLDNPESVANDRLRSRGGCVLESAPPMVLPPGIAIGSIPHKRYVKAVFEGAPSLGPLKVYPKMRDFIEEKNLTHEGSIIELYEVLPDNRVRTTFLFPVTPVQ